jgi:hypothetical protein
VGEPYIFDMINAGGHVGNVALGLRKSPRRRPDIDGQPLFNAPSTNAMAFYADGEGDEETEDEENTEADPDVDVEDVGGGGTTITTGTFEMETRAPSQVSQGATRTPRAISNMMSLPLR